MNCQDRQIQISRYLRGDLPDAEVSSLLDHLEQCKACRAVEQELRSADQFLDGSADPAVPPFLNKRIVARIAEQMADDRNTGFLAGFFKPLRALKPLRAAGVLLAALFLGVLTGSSLLPSFGGIHQNPQSDVVALAFGSNLELANFESVCLDDQGNR